MSVEVDVQSDREDAERDDAGVEVAAHFLTIPPPRNGIFCRLWSQAAVLGLQWHLTQIAYRAAITRPREVRRAAPLRGTLLLHSLRLAKASAHGASC